MGKEKSSVYQVKITLRHSDPLIWRRVHIASDTTLTQLHKIIQTAMGWTNSHLHIFKFGEQQYSAPMPHDPYHLAEMRAKTTHRVKLNTLVQAEGETFVYCYDFGDDWLHDILVEKTSVTDVDRSTLPTCIEGERACPPEDIAGIHRYANFLQAISDETHPEHAMYREWVSDDFDGDAFDLEAVNKGLKRLR